MLPSSSSSSTPPQQQQGGGEFNIIDEIAVDDDEELLPSSKTNQSSEEEEVETTMNNHNSSTAVGESSRSSKTTSTTKRNSNSNISNGNKTGEDPPGEKESKIYNRLVLLEEKIAKKKTNKSKTDAVDNDNGTAYAKSPSKSSPSKSPSKSSKRRIQQDDDAIEKIAANNGTTTTTSKTAENNSDDNNGRTSTATTASTAKKSHHPSKKSSSKRRIKLLDDNNKNNDDGGNNNNNGKRKIPLLKEWVENRDGSLTGKIYYDNKYPDGTKITTSQINQQSQITKTKDGFLVRCDKNNISFTLDGTSWLFSSSNLHDDDGVGGGGFVVGGSSSAAGRTTPAGTGDDGNNNPSVVATSDNLDLKEATATTVLPFVPTTPFVPPPPPSTTTAGDDNGLVDVPFVPPSTPTPLFVPPPPTTGDIGLVVLHEEEGIISSQPPLQPAARFPKPFYCPITKQIMNDPVVNVDGISYERQALLDSRRSETTTSDDTNNDNDIVLYTNRALKAVIDETKIQQLERLPSLRDGLMRLHDSIKSGLSQVLEGGSGSTRSLGMNQSQNPLPDVYYCPITFNLMHDPVIDPEGNTCERVAVENWIRIHGNSPITRTALQISQLRSNLAIHDLLDIEKSKPPEEIHPSIEKWMDEPIPQSTDPELGGNILSSANSGQPENTLTPEQQQALQEEAEQLAERHRRARVFCSILALFFTVLFYVLFFRFGGFGMLFLGILCCNYACRFSSAAARGDENDEQQGPRRRNSLQFP